MYSACNTAKSPDWFNSQNQLLSLIKTISLISRSLHNSSQQDLTTHDPYTYIHFTHLIFCGRTLKCTLFEIVYEEKKEPQNKSMPIS